VSIFIFVLGVLVGEGRGPASIVPEDGSGASRPAMATAALPAEPLQRASKPTVTERPEATNLKREPQPNTSAPTKSTKQARREPAKQREVTRPTTRKPVMTMQGGFAIQVLAVSELQTAQNIRLQLKGLGHPAFIASGSYDGLYRVRVGNFVERSDAVTVRESLQAAGYGAAWIVAMPSIP
jgi:cell division septation protein DedD